MVNLSRSNIILKWRLEIVLKKFPLFKLQIRHIQQAKWNMNKYFIWPLPFSRFLANTLTVNKIPIKGFSTISHSVLALNCRWCYTCIKLTYTTYLMCEARFQTWMKDCNVSKKCIETKKNERSKIIRKLIRDGNSSIN